MRKFAVEDRLDRVLKKTCKKDKQTYNHIMKKFEEILTCENIDHYKNLKTPLQDFKRIHIGAFILMFKHDKKEDKIYFYDFDHHDNIYK